jgi:N-formylglutamate deformylase
VSDFVHIVQGEAPLIVAFPHGGTHIPAEIETQFVSSWRARMDTDWWIDRLYEFAPSMGATTVRTSIARAVIDVNRDPSGASLYPGQATTELCPTTTFDGAPLYRDGATPDQREMDERKQRWFAPYHYALRDEIARLRRLHGRVVLYDAHSIRSRVPRLFDGLLPVFNVGTNGGSTCANALREAVVNILDLAGESFVADGRFRGGWTTRYYGRPAEGVHAIQMELAQRAYLEEPENLTPDNWPPPLDDARASHLRSTLQAILNACLTFANQRENLP